MRIITFKVRSLAQSRSNETCYYNIYTVWPGFRIVTVFSFFSPLFRKNCSTRFFLSVIFFLSFFLFFILRVDLQAFENWSRVHNRLSDHRNYTLAAPTYRSAIKYWFSFTSMTMIRRHRGLVFWQKVDRMSDPRANRKRAPCFTVEREETMTRGDGWSRRGSRMNSKRASRFLFAQKEEGSSPGVFCKEISTDGEGKPRGEGMFQAAAS